MKSGKGKTLSVEDLREIARQLAAPEGEAGIKTGERMQENNAGMIRKAIDLLDLQDNKHVLEIGPGNGSHLSYLIAQGQNITYEGVDVSETMLLEANRLNRHLVDENKIAFTLVDGEKLPFNNAHFDYCFTVNTVYFWKNPGCYLLDIYRTLKKGGRFCLCFAPASFMKTLPFTAYGFNLYEPNELVVLLTETGFKIKDIKYQEESVISNGAELTRTFAVIIADK